MIAPQHHMPGPNFKRRRKWAGGVAITGAKREYRREGCGGDARFIFSHRLVALGRVNAGGATPLLSRHSDVHIRRPRGIVVLLGSLFRRNLCLIRLIDSLLSVLIGCSN